jgi:hypothetical protein
MATTKTTRKTPGRVGGSATVTSGVVSLKAAAAASPAVPAVPAGFKPLNRETAGKLKKPVPVQAASVEGAATEIQQSTTYAQDFSKNAPSAAAVAAALLAAQAATVTAHAAEEYAEYASTQKQLAWNNALMITDTQLRPEWDYAVADDSTIPKRYPELALFMSAKTVQAQQTAAKRKAKNKKAAKAKAAPAKT